MHVVESSIEIGKYVHTKTIHAAPSMIPTQKGDPFVKGPLVDLNTILDIIRRIYLCRLSRTSMAPPDRQ